MNNLKRTIAILCVAASMLAAVGCGKGEEKKPAESTVATTVTEATEGTEVSEETTTAEPEVVEILSEESDFTFAVKDGKATLTAFSGDATTVIIPATYEGSDVVAIADDAFNGCIGITKVEIPEGITTIGVRAFYNCQGLTEVVIPSGVTKIGDLAFSVCMNLSSVTVPESVTDIGYAPFFACDSVTIKCKEGSVIAEYAKNKINVEFITE